MGSEDGFRVKQLNGNPGFVVLNSRLRREWRGGHYYLITLTYAQLGDMNERWSCLCELWTAKDRVI